MFRKVQETSTWICVGVNPIEGLCAAAGTCSCALALLITHLFPHALHMFTTLCFIWDDAVYAGEFSIVAEAKFSFPSLVFLFTFFPFPALLQISFHDLVVWHFFLH